MSHHPSTGEILSSWTRRVCGRNVKNQPADIKIMWSSLQTPAKASLFHPNHFVLLKTQPPSTQPEIITIDEEWPALKRRVDTTTVTPVKKTRKKIKSPLGRHVDLTTTPTNTKGRQIVMGECSTPVTSNTTTDISTSLSQDTLHSTPAKESSHISDFLAISKVNDSSTLINHTATPNSTISSNISIPAEPIVADGGKLPSGPKSQNKFLDIENIVQILTEDYIDPPQCVPRGLKENVYFVVDNKENLQRR